MRSNSYGRLAGKEEAEAIISLAQQFDKNLNGKSFLICFGTKTLRFLEVSFSAGNFSHLAGIDKHNCRIKPHEVYARAIAGNLKPQDLGYSIAPKFKMKTIAAKFLNEFGSTATHVSAVNKRRSKVNAEIWISGSKAGFAIGAIHIGSKKSGPVTFAPTSLQLLSDIELQEKSVGTVEPIAIILSRRNDEMSYSVIEFLDENLTEIHSSSLASILLSCGNEVALRNKYPELCDRLFDKDFEHFGIRHGVCRGVQSNQRPPRRNRNEPVEINTLEGRVPCCPLSPPPLRWPPCIGSSPLYGKTD